MSLNSFNARTTLTVGGNTHEIFNIGALPGSETLPFTHKVLLENLLRTEDGANVTAADDGSKTLDLYLTFESSVTDNQQFEFAITNANVTAAGSNSSLFTTFPRKVP